MTRKIKREIKFIDWNVRCLYNFSYEQLYPNDNRVIFLEPKVVHESFYANRSWMHEGIIRYYPKATSWMTMVALFGVDISKHKSGFAMDLDRRVFLNKKFSIDLTNTLLFFYK